jgi:hypothetical protein
MKAQRSGRSLRANHVLTETYRLPRRHARGSLAPCHWLRMAAIRPSFLALEHIHLDAGSPLQANCSGGGNLGKRSVCPKRSSM